MSTSIGYLERLREDLLDAGLRERARRGRRVPSMGRWPSRRTLVAAVAAVTVLAAGTIGWFVTRDDRRMSFQAAGGAEGATGETGAAGRRLSLFDPTVLPADRGSVDALVGSTTLEPQRVIRTAEIGVVIPRDSFEDRFAEAVEIAEANGGFVATSTTRERSGNLTVRVPADRFNDTLASLRGLGEVEVQTVQGRDVTAQFVDLEARLRIAEARREVLLDLMERANSIQQTIRVQNALDDTQVRIEEIQGQLRLLDDRASLATVRVRLREQGVDPTEVRTASIPNAFERSVAGFVAVIAGIVVGIGYVIPVLLIALGGWLLVVWTRRRRTA